MLARTAAERAGQALAEPASAQNEGDAAAADQIELFTLLAGAVRRSIMLERRLVAGHAATTAPRNQADPRRDKAVLALRRATRGRIDASELCEEANEMLDEELAQDPDGTTPLPDLLATICEDLGFELDHELAADFGGPDPRDQAGEQEESSWPGSTQPPGTPH